MVNDSVKKIITFEEHYICPEVDDHFRKVVDRTSMSETHKRKLDMSAQWVKQKPIADFGERRLSWMDEHGIDIQVLQYGDNSPSDLPSSESVSLCREANDFLADQIKKKTDRYIGFATLPVDSPLEAAKEAERAVNELGFKGIAFKATYAGKEFFDNKRFIPMWEAIADLNVPVTFHPNETVAQVAEAYYQGDNIHPMASMLLSGFGIGWHYETGVAYLRMICSGLFDKYPDMKMIIGHWGETLPFYFDRLDMSFEFLRATAKANPGFTSGALERKISEYFCENMYVTPSGMYDKVAMDLPIRTCLEVFGADHIIWSNDFPYRADHSLANTKKWINSLELSFEDKEKIAHLNGEKLLRI